MRRLLGGGAAVLFILAGLAGGVTTSATAAELDQTSIDFGTRNSLGDVASGLGVKVIPAEGETVEVESVEIDQASGGPFSANIEDACFLDWADEVPDCVQVTVWFDYWSAAPGPWSGTLKIQTNVREEPFEVSLSGRIERTTFEIDQESHDFGSTPLGLTEGGSTHTFTLTSTGSKPYQPGWHLRSEDGSFTVQETDCERQLDPGESCGITVAFRPTGSKAGIRSGWLDVSRGLMIYGAELVGEAVAPAVPARLRLKVSGKLRSIPGKARISVSATNRGGSASEHFVVRVTGPKRLVRAPGATSFSALAAGDSMTRQIPVRFRGAAAGRRVTLKLVARQRGKVFWSTTRSVRVLGHS